MGYYTEVVLYYKSEIFVACHRDSWEYEVEEVLRLLTIDYIVYKDHITNMDEFLNTFFPSLHNFKYLIPYWEKIVRTARGLDLTGDNIYWVHMIATVVNITHKHTKAVVCNKHKRKTLLLNPTTKIDFYNFLNNRFLIDKIWKKYNVPNNLQEWINFQVL